MKKEYLIYKLSEDLKEATTSSLRKNKLIICLSSITVNTPCFLKVLTLS